jgi:hypothetical protein
MAQFNPKEFVYHYRNGKPAYYSYDEELYCGTFPEKWAQNHLPDTGPKECKNCVHYGSWNGVFLGYCTNCSQYEYKGERGRGFANIGTERNDNIVASYTSVFDTYLKGVSPDEVGDKDFMDSFAVLKTELENLQVPEDENNILFEERYPDIDFDEVNAYYDKNEEKEVTYTLDYVGGGSFCGDYDGGYDSY